jgi:xylitol oxidase
VSEVRSVAADPQWMSMATGAAQLGLHFTWHRDPVAVAAVLPVLERALAPFDPRPHWGKLTTLDAGVVASRYPRIGAFADLVDRVDPDRRFGNAFLSDLLG